MRISYFPIFTIETVLGAELLSEMLERAMKACVVRNLPDIRLDLVHIVESRNMAESNGGSAQPPPQPLSRSETLAIPQCKSSNQSRAAASGKPDLADSPRRACYLAPTI
jgi:hypothetical protein